MESRPGWWRIGGAALKERLHRLLQHIREQSPVWQSIPRSPDDWCNSLPWAILALLEGPVCKMEKVLEETANRYVPKRGTYRLQSLRVKRCHTEYGECNQSVHD